MNFNSLQAVFECNKEMAPRSMCVNQLMDDEMVIDKMIE